MIRRLLVFDVFAKSFLIQAAWNVERMQNVGFLFALRRSLKSIWSDDPKNYEAACARAYSFFNTHPYFSPAMMGVALHIEEKISAGLALPEDIERVKLRISAPLNALGSLWFWDHLRLLAFLLSLPLFLLADPIALAAGAGLFLLFFNFFHLRARWVGLRLGLQYGEEMVPDLLSLFPSQLLQTCRRVSVLLLGIATPVMVAVLFTEVRDKIPEWVETYHIPEFFYLPLAAGLLLVGVSTVVLYNRWLSVYQLLAVGLAVSVGAARWL